MNTPDREAVITVRGLKNQFGPQVVHENLDLDVWKLANSVLPVECNLVLSLSLAAQPPLLVTQTSTSPVLSTRSVRFRYQKFTSSIFFLRASRLAK